MALEDLTGASKFIDDLVNTNPVGGTDPKSEGDDHIRGIKNVLQNTLPNITGAITPTETELNYVGGVTSALQAQMDLKSPLASPTFTGVVTLPTGAVGSTQTAGDNSTSLATTAFVQAEPADTYTAGSVDQAAIAASAVGQGELKEALQQTSRAIVSGGVDVVTFTGATYTLGWSVGTSGAISDVSVVAHSDGTYADKIGLLNSSAGSRTFYFQARYIQASPPYNLGDGEIPLFVYAVMDNATGLIVGYDIAEDPPWANNGPTDIRGKLGADGKKYRERRDMSSMPFTHAQAKADPAKLRDYYASFKDAPIIQEEITQAIKNADMGLIPKPMQAQDGQTIILLDTQSPILHELVEMRKHDEFNPADILTAGHFVVDNAPLTRAGPPGIPVHGFRWK